MWALFRKHGHPPTGDTVLVLFLCQPVMCLHYEEEKKRCIKGLLSWKEINIPGLPSTINLHIYTNNVI
ncbi:hypothetical protein MTR_2g101490 [Medicago truncatula]|uniref:Transmembrane protein n=1 Tax=Medicago truncatula TaxID=3880 RepID=G7IUP1_MEDTR|nr:hypothetical protein MTR_2g101490 [Medicago truncatula]